MPTVVITLSSSTTTWQDTGFVVPGTQLATATAACVGDVFYGPDGQPGTVSPHVNGSGNLNGPGYNAFYAPTFTLASFPSLPASTIPVTGPNQIRTYDVLMLFLPDGQNPNPTPINGGTQWNSNVFSFAYAPTVEVDPVHGTDTVSRSFTSADFSGFNPGIAYRCWVIHNDPVQSDNVGSFVLTLTYCFPPQTEPTLSGTWSLNPDDCTSTNVISWNPIATATGYRIYGAIRGLLSSVTSPTYTDTSAQNDAYTVVPFNACGDGPTSAPLQLQPNANIPAVPTTVCQRCCQSIVVVTWTAVTATKDSSGSQDVVGYTLIRRGSDSSEVTLLEWSPSQAMLNNYQFRDDSVQLGITYTYDMVAFYGSNCQDSPDTFVPIKITGNTTPALPTCAIGTPTLPGNGWQTPGCRCDSLPVNSGKR